MYVNEERYLYVAVQSLKCMQLFCQVNETDNPLLQDQLIKIQTLFGN